MFLLFEMVHKEKNDAIINTLTVELEKINVPDAEINEPQEQHIIKRKPKRNKNNDNDMLSKMMKDMGKSNDPDMKKLLKMTSQMMSDMNTNKPCDMSKMLQTFLPELNTTKNDGMMNDLMSDITTSMSGINNVDDVFSMTKGLGEKYQKMISEGTAEPGEILGSLMGLMTDDKFTQELSKIDMSKLKPEDMLSKMMSEIAPQMMNSEMLSGMMGMSGGGDGNLNIGSLLSGLTGVAGGVSGVEETVKPDDTPLSAEQLNEMEEFYANINISAD
jgi:DNA repair ATPase RecN